MEKNMKVNFDFLKERVVDSLDNTDLEFIRNELSKLNEPTLFSGVGGSSVVSEFDVTNTHVEEGVTLPEVGGRGILNLLVIGMIIMMTSVFGVLRLDRD